MPSVSNIGISQLLNDYTNFITGSTVTTNDYINATQVMSSIFNILLKSPTPDNLTSVWNFFVLNENDLVQEAIALYGISSLSDSDRAVYTILYSLFRQATNGLIPVLNAENVISILVQAPTILQFLTQASLSVTPGTLTQGPLTPPLSGSDGGVILSNGTLTVSGTLVFGSGLTLTGSGNTYYLTSSGGGSSYTLPAATSSTLGGVKPDGTTILNSSGAISVGTVPAANVTGVELLANKNTANGYAGLDGSGKLPTSLIPTALLGDPQYQGTWNASTNTPTIVSSVGTQGNYYIVNVAGNTTINGISNWIPGDWIIYDGSSWSKVDGNPSEVVSVAGRSGAVTLTHTDITDWSSATSGFGSGSSYTLPAATSTTLGGVLANSGTAGQFVNGINPSTGALTYGTPSGSGGSSTFVGLSDGPGSITANKFLKGNSGGTALQFFTGSVVQNFTFTITFTGTDPSAVSNVPSGWTVTIPSQDTINIQHNLGAPPIQIFIWGLTTTADTWTQRSVGNGSLNLTYNDTTPNVCQINGVSTTATAAAGLTAKVVLFFAL